MVRLGYLVVKRRQRMCDKAQRRKQNIDPQRHIRRKHHADLVMLRKVLHPEDIRLAIARRAKHDVGAVPLASAQKRAGRGRVGKIDHNVGWGVPHGLLQLRSVPNENAGSLFAQ
ncbi:hypothetical protein SDC9_135751 [bioreactor metagenome]|uniref:Uncharacterized protein n=1 Tax=bioreactor metagenome TaxID=1076179 RepID=A0A645DHB5_9ZZZZ